MSSPCRKLCVTINKPPPPYRSAGRAVAPKGAFFFVGYRVGLACPMIHSVYIFGAAGGGAGLRPAPSLPPCCRPYASAFMAGACQLGAYAYRKTPCSLKVAGESGCPYRGGRFFRLTRPQQPNPALSAHQKPRNRLLSSSDGGAQLRCRITIRPRRLRRATRWRTWHIDSVDSDRAGAGLGCWGRSRNLY